jgi:putative effector of murein hydrolase LrgA (UPF0299 family)
MYSPNSTENIEGIRKTEQYTYFFMFVISSIPFLLIPSQIGIINGFGYRSDHLVHDRF